MLADPKLVWMHCKGSLVQQWTVKGVEHSAMKVFIFQTLHLSKKKQPFGNDDHHHLLHLFNLF